MESVSMGLVGTIKTDKFQMIIHEMYVYECDVFGLITIYIGGAEVYQWEGLPA